MADRPSTDELKRRRDGHLGAGKPPPECDLCGATGPQVRPVGTRTVAYHPGGRRCETLYQCVPECDSDQEDDDAPRR